MTRDDSTARGALAAALILAGCAAPAAPPAAPVEVAPEVAPVEVVPEVAQEVAPVATPAQRAPPDGFVDLRVSLPKACFQVGYATKDNFTGAPLPGYGAPGAWLLAEPAAALGRVLDRVAAEGWTLVIYDAYRPLRGTLAMVAWAKRTDQAFLLDGYIASRSRHNHGTTVDLGLATPGTCALPDMGTPWDTLDARSHLKNAAGDVLARRMTLANAMRAEGFASYWREWWHYERAQEGTRGRNVPYGAEEPDEGAWKPPVGWDRPPSK